MAVSPIPAGYHTVTPYLVVDNAKQLITFLQAAFDAEIKSLFEGADEAILNAEVKIGDSMLMIADARDNCRAKPTMLYLYVPDVDAAYQRAIAAGAESMMEPADQFYGDRNGGVRDHSGNEWWLATHIEDVSEDEVKRRAQQYLQQQA